MDTRPAADVNHEDPRRTELLELNNAMVGLYKEVFGRGPTKARSDYAGPDVILTTVQNSLTPAGQNLVSMSEHQRLHDIRTFFQHAHEQEFRGRVEQITGRKVWAFVSGIDTRQDVSSEVFYLEPVGPPDPE